MGGKRGGDKKGGGPKEKPRHGDEGWRAAGAPASHLDGSESERAGADRQFREADAAEEYVLLGHDVGNVHGQNENDHHGGKQRSGHLRAFFGSDTKRRGFEGHADQDGPEQFKWNPGRDDGRNVRGGGEMLR